MNANKTTCLQLGGNRCIAIAKVQAAKPLERHPVASFGKMECRQLGDGRTIQVGKVGGIASKGQ